MTNAHKADLATFQTKKIEYDAAILVLKNDHSPAEIAKARDLNTELKSIQAKLVAHTAADDAAKGLAGDAPGFDSFLNAPGTGMKHLGSVQSGVDAVARDGKSVIASNGAGIFGAKTWEGIKDPDYKRFFVEYLRKGERMSGDAYKLLEVGIDSQGGYLAPPEMLERIVERKPTPTRLAGMVEQVNVGRDAVILPRVNYQGNNGDDVLGQIYSTGFRVTNTEENPPVNGLPNVNDTNLFGTIRIDNFTHMIEGTLTNSQAEDPAIDVLGWVEGKFDQTIDIFRDDLILNGNGIQQATGILPYALTANNPVPLPVLLSSLTGQLNGDDAINLAYDIPEQYEEGINYVFNKTQTFKYLKTLKDSTGRYLFGAGNQDNGLAVSRPKTLEEYPYIFSALMRQYLVGGVVSGGFASGTTPMLCGDLKGYTQTLRLGFSVQVCRELLVRQNQILLVGRIRLGGMPVEPWRMRLLKVK